MKMNLLAVSLGALVGMAFVARPAVAGQVKAAGLNSADAQVVMLAKDDVKAAEKDKPKKTKTKKNDGKDSDPDDGNAGGGNDGKTLPNDGPAND